jgi:hypothetical protein
MSMLSEWKNIEESTCKVIIMVGPSLENWGLKPSEAILMHQMEFFGVSYEKWILVEGFSTFIGSNQRIWEKFSIISFLFM